MLCQKNVIVNNLYDYLILFKFTIGWRTPVTTYFLALDIYHIQYIKFLNLLDTTKICNILFQRKVKGTKFMVSVEG